MVLQTNCKYLGNIGHTSYYTESSVNVIMLPTHILGLPAAYVCPPLEGKFGDFLTPGFLNLLSSSYQKVCCCIMFSPPVRTLDLDVV